MSSPNTISKEIENEIEELQKAGFLLPQENAQSLIGSLHLSELWAEIFWLRRHQHATREDPEVSHIFKSNPQSILEVGCAYGRVMRKIAEANKQYGFPAQLTGIELCPYCAPYFKRYSSENPLLDSVQVIFDDFFTSDRLKAGSFDVIVLPMNTFPSFPVETLPQLFRRTKELLSDEGLWIFSTYKIRGNLVANASRHDGEIRVREGQGPIVAEFYVLPRKLTDYGAREVTYARYTKLRQDHQKQQSYLFRNLVELLLPQMLQFIIEENGFDIAFQDVSSHSAVYGLHVGQ
ncbi:MAG: class I SAM-dependent methyltransferase [Candidatus Hodarchaeota archaeon]